MMSDELIKIINLSELVERGRQIENVCYRNLPKVTLILPDSPSPTHTYDSRQPTGLSLIPRSAVHSGTSTYSMQDKTYSTPSKHGVLLPRRRRQTRFMFAEYSAQEWARCTVEYLVDTVAGDDETLSQLTETVEHWQDVVADSEVVDSRYSTPTVGQKQMHENKVEVEPSVDNHSESISIMLQQNNHIQRLLLFRL